MKFGSTILSSLLVAVFASSSLAQDGDISKYRLKRSAAPSPAKARISSSAGASRAVDPENLTSQAQKELMLAPDDVTTTVLETPATVRLRVEEVRNPIRPLAYRVGVSVQPFTPAGSMAVGNLAPYDLAEAGTQPMIALDGQWLPFTFQNVSGLQGGFFGSLGYAKHTLRLMSPTGMAIENTQLHSIKAQAGVTASYQLPKSPLWSLHANLGGGRLGTIQSSSSSFANSSTTTWFGSLGLAAERSIVPTFSAFFGYDLRVALARSAPGADVPQHNILLGLLGNFE